MVSQLLPTNLIIGLILYQKELTFFTPWLEQLPTHILEFKVNTVTNVLIDDSVEFKLFKTSVEELRKEVLELRLKNERLENQLKTYEKDK